MQDDPFEDTQANPRSVAGQVAPQEAKAQDQPAQRRLADRVDPGGVVQLAELDSDGERHRQQGDRPGRGPGQEQADAEEGRERPERVPGIGRDEPRQSVPKRREPSPRATTRAIRASQASGLRRVVRMASSAGRSPVS